MDASKKRLLYKKMLDEGYESISEFHRNTKIPLAFETVRRSINDEQPINAHSFMLMARYLGFSPKEIKRVLLSPAGIIVESDHRAAKIFADLIGDQDIPTPREAAFIGLLAKMRSNKQVYKSMIDFVRIVCLSAGIHVEEELGLLKNW